MWDSFECSLRITLDEWEMVYDKNDNPLLQDSLVASNQTGGILMQHTGKFDKNTRPIFAGDIVKHFRQCFDWDKPEGEEEFIREEIGVVEYSDHGFWIGSCQYNEDFGWEGEGLWNWNKLEVIGNIYEHPHLIPDKPNFEEIE